MLSNGDGVVTLKTHVLDRPRLTVAVLGNTLIKLEDIQKLFKWKSFCTVGSGVYSAPRIIIIIK